MDNESPLTRDKLLDAVAECEADWIVGARQRHLAQLAYWKEKLSEQRDHLRHD